MIVSVLVSCWKQIKQQMHDELKIASLVLVSAIVVNVEIGLVFGMNYSIKPLSR